MLHIISFDALRAGDIPGAVYLKPEHMFKERARILEADWVIFPETWQVGALVCSLKKRIFPSFNSYHLGRDKIEMTRAFQALCPEHVPRTLILPSTPAALDQIEEDLGYPLVVKEPRESMGRGVFRLDRRADLERYAATHEVLYAQEFLTFSQDLRIVWIGDHIATAYWRIGGDGFHHNISCGAVAGFEDIPEPALELVRRVATNLGVDHAGFDVAWVDGQAYLIELNLFFGNDIINQAGIRLGPHIMDYLERCSQTHPPTIKAVSA